MIEVKIHTVDHKIQTITITGHALSGPKGHDLVCAGVSSIATGALNGLISLQANCVKLIYQEDPEALIEIKVIEDNEELQTLLRFISYQLRTVEDSHPKNIHIQEVFS